MARSPFRPYIRVLTRVGPLSLLLGFMVATVYGHLTTNFWVFRCNAKGYSDEYYLSYCPDKAFEDYEHGAFYFPSDPQSAANFSKADAIFLGNSRAEHSFSSSVILNYFLDHGLRPFVLAFNGEFDNFPKLIMERLNARPRYVVVNADYFFFNTINVMGKHVTQGGAAVALEYRLKTQAEGLHQRLCKERSSALSRLICGDGPAQFRSRIDGHIVDHNWPQKSPLPLARYGQDLPDERYPAIRNAAETFKSFVESRGGCLILTAIPSPECSPKVARRLGNDLGVPMIEVPDQGYESLDGSHMNPQGADRWAGEFLKGLDDARRRCDAPSGEGSGLTAPTAAH